MKSFRILGLALAIAAAQTPVGAQSKVTLVPSASVSSVYDDNLFAKSVGSGDQMTLITPGVEGTYETPTTFLLGNYSFDMQRSIDHPALNNIQARRHALIDTRFQTSPHFTLNVTGRYDRTDTAGELNFTSGLLLDRRRAERWEAGPSFSFKASPLVTISGLYNWISESVDESVGGYEQVARLGVTRQNTSRASTTVGVLARRFVSADQTIVPSGLPTTTANGDVQTFSDGFMVVPGGTFMSTAGLVMWTYQLAPATMLALQGGPRYSSARATVLPEIVASVGRKAAGIVNYGVDYWRGESIILGVLGPVEVNSVTSKVSWPIRTNLEFGVFGGFFDSETLSQGSARVYHGEVVGSWTLKAPLTIAVSYGADFQRGDVRSSLLSDQQVVRHVVLVRLTAAPHLSRSLRPDDPLQPLGSLPRESK